MQIFPSITTITRKWREQIKEINKLGLSEVCVFLSNLDVDKHAEIFTLLEKTKLKTVPFIHINNKTTPDELKFWIKRWGTQVFNIHSERQYPNEYNLTAYKDKIYIENAKEPWDEDEIQRWGGICLDFAHMEGDKMLKLPKYYTNWKILKKYHPGCGHIGAIYSDQTWFDEERNQRRNDYHVIRTCHDLDYLKNYPLEVFPEIVAIELEEPLAKQLEIKLYIEKLLGL